MSDNSHGSEVADDVLDVPESTPSDTHGAESPEPDNDEVVLDEKEGDVWKDLESKTKAGAELAKKTGALAYAENTIQTQLIERAMAIEEDMNKEGTEANKLKYVWEEALTPEGRSEFLKGNTLIWKIFEAAKNGVLPMVNIAENVMHFFKRKTFDAKNLSITDFKPETIQIYCSLGLLECSEEEAKSIDEMAAKGLKIAAKGAKVLSWIALAIPAAEEFSPVLDKVAKGAAIIEKPAEWAANLMPGVRSEVKRRSVEVLQEQMAQHNEVGADVQPQVIIPANGPMDEQKKNAA